jgi:hypothetical protein
MQISYESKFTSKPRSGNRPANPLLRTETHSRCREADSASQVFTTSRSYFLSVALCPPASTLMFSLTLFFGHASLRSRTAKVEILIEWRWYEVKTNVLKRCLRRPCCYLIWRFSSGLPIGHCLNRSNFRSTAGISFHRKRYGLASRITPNGGRIRSVAKRS